jgi:hypothetical protein
MKRAKSFRTLEELWELEERYPPVDACFSVLLRWMMATDGFAHTSPNGRTCLLRNGAPAWRAKSRHL